jgi:thiosulfate/3-mercaptopyruvate sulfurtransferase
MEREQLFPPLSGSTLGANGTSAGGTLDGSSYGWRGTRVEPLVSTGWLAERIGDPDLVVVDASWHMPADNRDGRTEFGEVHIPGAVFLDIDVVRDTANPVPHMLPSADQFGVAMTALGIGGGDRIVVYDNSPYRTAARGWFMFRHFGSPAVAILDGGLGKWRAEGRPLEAGPAQNRGRRFMAQAQQAQVVDKHQLRDAPPAQVVDARSRQRFEGAVPEPRAGLASGHIPGSRNLPFAALYRDDGTFKPRDELARLFAEAGIDPRQPFVATCGSGVTANSLIFAAHLLGNDQVGLYDGSWSEWGADPVTPKATGPA